MASRAASSSLPSSLPLKLTLFSVSCSLSLLWPVSGLAGPPASIEVVLYAAGNYLIPQSASAAATAKLRPQVASAHSAPGSPIVFKGSPPKRRLGLKPFNVRSKSTAKGALHTLAATASTAPVGAADSYTSRFKGISQLEQEEAAYDPSNPNFFGGKQSMQDPANVGLAAGGGYTIQVVSSAIVVTNSNGGRLCAVTELNQFFNLQAGDFLLNPRALYDSGNGRFYVTVSGITAFSPSAFPDLLSYQLIAISKGRNPMAGFYYYYYDTALPSNYHTFLGVDLCPCFASFQTLGFTADSITISAFAVSLDDQSYAGTVLQAISKSELARGKATTNGVRFDGDPTKFNGYLTLSGAYVNESTGDVMGTAFSVQPAHLPPLFNSKADMPPAAYFLSTDAYTALTGSGIELWALTRTSILSSGNNPTAVRLSQVSIPTVGYSWPQPGAQRAGPTPLGTSYGAPLEEIDTGDDRMQQVVYANGLLFGAFTTGTADGSGIFYVAIKPSVDASGQVAGTLVASGIITSPGLSLAYPAISANRKRAVIVYTATGPSTFPSIAYAYIDCTTYAVTKFTAFTGVEPIDGFMGYSQAGYPVTPGIGTVPPVSPFGEYSAAVGDGDGSFWVAGETTPGGPRDMLANWGTVVARLKA